MKKTHAPRSRKLRYVLFLSAACALLVAKKIYDFAVPPYEAKDCTFAYPEATDTTKETTITMLPESPVVFEQEGGVINDASCLNQTAVYGIVDVQSEDDIKNALFFAQENDLKVTAAGQRHSMGGQSFTAGGLVLNMKTFNEMTLDKENKVLHVQTGALWQDVQELLDKEGLSVKAMQSINIFTVGGTLSVNAHGIAHDPGPIAPTVRSLRIMLSDGTIKTASPTENEDLFRAALGGYGLVGVILDVDLDVVDNEAYELSSEYMDYTEFADYYAQHVEGNKDVGLFYGRLSVSPLSYLTEAVVHVYKKTEEEVEIPVLQPDQHDTINRFIINFSKTGSIGRWFRWTLEKYVEPSVHRCSRNQAMSQKEVCLVSRNQEMYDSMGYLKNRLEDTDILQEYFIPHDQMAAFVDGLRSTVQKNGANLLNVTIRIVSKDTVTSLPYAKEDMFAFVLYFNQKLSVEESKTLQQTTVDLIDVATNLGGTYYLPYQLYYSPEELRAAYPEIDAFFAQKQSFDPLGLFSNKFYQKYGPQ